MTLYIGETLIDDTFAEAFGMRYSRLIVTALDQHWLDAARDEFTGYATSVIGCDLEMGVERQLSPRETPDGRPGFATLAFAFSIDALAAALPARTGQCLMTCPTTAVFNGLPGEFSIGLGQKLRLFGDGFQKSKLLGQDRYWRIPVMDGEFVVADKVGAAKGIAGGNLILQGRSTEPTLGAARRAIESIRDLAGIITPFPGGVVRSGSKVGSRYKGLKASTADAFCPTLRGRVQTRLHPQANVALEIVMDGVDEACVRLAMATVMRAAAGPDLVAISAGNYGGRLGPYHLHLHEILQQQASTEMVSRS
jgi:formylmethanofuran--tetrahydromethanopterin N-formyltransferase